MKVTENTPLDFILSISRDIIIQAQGHVIHVFQPPNDPKHENVGVTFTNISDADRETIRKYLAGTLTV
ncbi:MAG: hypothetical protein A2Z34_08960 [Planctomycetes bacterium RBG_16_59_8]|nr:MAG: hypothetical protein A2Z34_08960 [Planctomycetes bacterium RBG_16_59_8]